MTHYNRIQYKCEFI